MKETDNPFAPGAGKPPPELAGRKENLEKVEIILYRFKNGRGDRSSLFLGLRGVGKTVLLNTVDKMATGMGYHTVYVESPEDESLGSLLVPGLRKVLLRLNIMEGAKQKLNVALGALRSFASNFEIKMGDIGVKISPSVGVADSGVLDQDLIDLLVAVGEAAQEANSAVAILIDELQYVKLIELAALFAGIHRVGQLQLPLVLFGAGLPQLAGLSGTAKSYAERLFDFQEIGPLKEADAMIAIKEPLEKEGVGFEIEALKEIFKQTEGYPYFLQEWGAHTWRIAKESPVILEDVKKATKETISTLDKGFFRVRFDRLTTIEKDYLRAMAELGRGPHRSGDIAAKLDRTVEGVAPFRSKLIVKGMVFSQQHGDTAFTVPKFDEYMKRAMPTFIPHPIKRRSS